MTVNLEHEARIRPVEIDPVAGYDDVEAWRRQLGSLDQLEHPPLSF